jgi:integrase/recombinase XerC
VSSRDPRHQHSRPAAGRARRRPIAARPHGYHRRRLITTPRQRPPLPTFADYIPQVCTAVSTGTSRVYGSYWNRILDRWGTRRLDEITPTDIKQLVEHTKTHVVARRNARGGRSAGEHLVAALRCLYRHAEDDGRWSPTRPRSVSCWKPGGPQRVAHSTRPAEAPRAGAATVYNRAHSATSEARSTSDIVGDGDSQHERRQPDPV